MEAHNRNALAIAQYLERRPKVAQVLHPGLESHPPAPPGQRQMTGFGGTFSFRLQGGQDEVFRLPGGRAALHPCRVAGGGGIADRTSWTMTHVSMPEEVRRAVGITENLIRILRGSRTRGRPAGRSRTGIRGCLIDTLVLRSVSFIARTMPEGGSGSRAKARCKLFDTSNPPAEAGQGEPAEAG